MVSVTRYRQYAADCVHQAQTQEAAEDKSILLNMAVGVFILLMPDQFTSLFGQPTATPDTWPRHWGAQLLAINLLYMPGYRDPVGAHPPPRAL